MTPGAAHVTPASLMGHGATPTTAFGPAQGAAPPQDELARFVGFVLDDVQTTWRTEIPGYQDTRLVLFDGVAASACGTATAAVGPFYCRSDRQVYVDLAFYTALRHRFGAPGDFAQAYVIAHEVGHHVQSGYFAHRDRADRAMGIGEIGDGDQAGAERRCPS